MADFNKGDSLNSVTHLQRKSIANALLSDSFDQSLQRPSPPILPKASAEQLPSLRDVVGQESATVRLSQHNDSDEHYKQLEPLNVPGLFDGKPYLSYWIHDSYYNMHIAQNETLNSFTRVTQDGRHLSYRLEVIQQPEKARACGSGPRSSADRRPVDPPPVVELRVFDGETDITFAYDVTLMLFASIEIARPIANGRMRPDPTPAPPPVLSGVTIASAAYLDRPKPAAYFIFPDLSVRHEGWYRLKFSLFEGIKHQHDADQGMEWREPAPIIESNPIPARHESMLNRLEVVSAPFQVWSAKKFPGLAMSTALSKCVAEQGCRVRIRRDIRQRRSGKDKKGGNEEGDDVSSYHGTPQAQYRTIEHSRSASRNSLSSHYEDIGRRLSINSNHERPAMLSRQSSMVSIPLASPSGPAPTMGSMAPPSYAPSTRPSVDGPPPVLTTHTPTHIQAPPMYAGPPTPTHSLPPLSSPTEPHRQSVSLPPLDFPAAPTNISRPAYNPVRKQWSNVPEPMSTKRSFSPQTYNSNAALKAGARPDTSRPPPPAWLGHSIGDNSIIEAETGDDEDGDSDDYLMNGELTYHRADGSRGNKVHRMPYMR